MPLSSRPHDDRDVSRPLVGFELCEHIAAICVWELNVQHDQVRPCCDRHHDGADSRAHADDSVAARFSGLLDHRVHHGVVVGDENTASAHGHKRGTRNTLRNEADCNTRAEVTQNEISSMLPSFAIRDVSLALTYS